MNNERRVLLSKYMAQAELQSRMKSINLSEAEQKIFFRRYDMFEKKAFKTLSGLSKNPKGSKSVSTIDHASQTQRATARSTISTSQHFGQLGTPLIPPANDMVANNSMFGATNTTLNDLGATSGSLARQSPTGQNHFGMTSSTFTLGNISKLEGYGSSLSPTMRKIKQANQFQFPNLNQTNQNPGSIVLGEENLMRTSPFHRNVSQFKIRRNNPVYRSLSAQSVVGSMTDCVDKLTFEFRVRTDEARLLKEKIKEWKDYEKANMHKDPIIQSVRDFTNRLRQSMKEDVDMTRAYFDECWEIGTRLDRLSDKLGGRPSL